MAVAGVERLITSREVVAAVAERVAGSSSLLRYALATCAGV